MTPKLFVGEGAQQVALQHAQRIVGTPSLVHPDLKVLVPERGELGIDRVREVLAWARYGPLQAAHKVAVIGPAERVSHEAANALLKVLEDTPPHLALVLFAQALDRVLPTVRSRCVVVRVASTAEAWAAELARQGYSPEEMAFVSWLVGDNPEAWEAFLGLRRQPLVEWEEAQKEAQGLGLVELASRWRAYVHDPLRRRALAWTLARKLPDAGADEALAVAEGLAHGGAEAVGAFCAELARFLLEEGVPSLGEARRWSWARKASLARGELEDNANVRLLAEAVVLWPKRP